MRLSRDDKNLLVYAINLALRDCVTSGANTSPGEAGHDADDYAEIQSDIAKLEKLKARIVADLGRKP